MDEVNRSDTLETLSVAQEINSINAGECRLVQEMRLTAALLKW